MTVAAILAGKGKDVFTVEPDTSLSTVIGKLAEKRVGAVVIVDNQGNVCGIVSERDIVRELANSGAALLDQPVSSIMTRKVISCSESDTVDQIMGTMTANRFRHLPVATNGKLAGLISIGDVVKRKIEQAERDAQEMRNYIATA